MPSKKQFNHRLGLPVQDTIGFKSDSVPRKKPASPVTASPEQPPPLRLTELERQAVLGFQARYRMIELEAQLASEHTRADQRTFEIALAERLGLPIDVLAGNKYTVNTQTWTIEPTTKPVPETTTNG